MFDVNTVTTGFHTVRPHLPIQSASESCIALFSSSMDFMTIPCGSTRCAQRPLGTIGLGAASSRSLKSSDITYRIEVGLYHSESLQNMTNANYGKRSVFEHIRQHLQNREAGLYNSKNLQNDQYILCERVNFLTCSCMTILERNSYESIFENDGGKVYIGAQ